MLPSLFCIRRNWSLPASFSASLASLDAHTLLLGITNTGLGVLHLNLSSGSPWLSCLSSAVTLAPGGSTSVAVRFTCGNQAPGDYTGQLTYTSDDPTHASGSLPMYLHIYAPSCASIKAA